MERDIFALKYERVTGCQRAICGFFGMQDS